MIIIEIHDKEYFDKCTAFIVLLLVTLEITHVAIIIITSM